MGRWPSERWRCGAAALLAAALAIGCGDGESGADAGARDAALDAAATDATPGRDGAVDAALDGGASDGGPEDAGRPDGSGPRAATWLPASGQTTCLYFDEAAGDAGEWVADPGCGEDYAVGDDDRPFGQDAHRPDALPAIDRTASDDGVTVSDRVTGLLWQRCALGQIYDAASDDCVAPVARQTHAGAVAYCEALDLAGRSWRLPSARELATLPDYGFAQPTLDPALFPGAPTDNQRHWAATVDAADTDRERAWTLSLPSGSLSTVLTIPGSSEFGVRCVSGPALPSRSFTDNGDGTVTESTTGLLFTRCALEAGGASPTADASAACERANEDVRWVDALEGCERLDFAGRTDWRLPPVRELALLVDFTRADPALDPAFFPLTTGDDEWTSTYSPLSPAARMAVQTWGNGLIRGNAGVSAARPARCVAGP